MKRGVCAIAIIMFFATAARAEDLAVSFAGATVGRDANSGRDYFNKDTNPFGIGVHMNFVFKGPNGLVIVAEDNQRVDTSIEPPSWIVYSPRDQLTPDPKHLKPPVDMFRGLIIPVMCEEVSAYPLCPSDDMRGWIYDGKDVRLGIGDLVVLGYVATDKINGFLQTNNLSFERETVTADVNVYLDMTDRSTGVHYICSDPAKLTAHFVYDPESPGFVDAKIRPTKK